MTKVLTRSRPIFLLAFSLLGGGLAAQASSPQACPSTTAALYERLRSVGLDEQRVYRVRGASIDRPNLHLDFDDGTIAFTQDICGRITGAIFEGDGEILLRPPDKVERESLAFFTGGAILEEQFSSGYLRFNDDTVTVLQPFLFPAEEGTEFVKRWDELSRSLADIDAPRLFVDFSHFLPIAGGAEPATEFPSLLHAHLLGKKLGAFEVFWDASATEPLSAGQPSSKDNLMFFNVWSSFAPGRARSADGSPESSGTDVVLAAFQIRAWVQPPTTVRASAAISAHVRKGGARTLLFELSRYLKIESVEESGRPLDFIQNQALEGSALRRRGNDLVAVVFPAPLRTGQELKLLFRYAGEVLSEAANGLLYVGERGNWYPNFGLNPAQFDLEFHYPAAWTLVATGKPVPIASDQKTAETAGEQISHWVSERPIALAGFNLGKYVRAEARTGKVLVEAYGTRVVEDSFPKPPPQELLEPPPSFRVSPPRVPLLAISPPPPPSPARNVQVVADQAARAISSFSQWFGPYPYGSLALTQMPGRQSQGWPGLVFLSSYSFLSPQEQADLRLEPVVALLNSQVLAHETAHQWWGDLVLWNGYRDQWIVEGLANYSALLVLEQQNPTQFREILEKYRRDLLSKNKDGEWLRQAGPVTLGQRLISSHFPGGYEAISYERGTWLFHMLRCMLRDSEMASHSRNGPAKAEEPFFRALRKVAERYAGKNLTTPKLLQVFEEELPRPLWYENRRSLDWFLDSWVNGTSLPRLDLREVRITSREGAVFVAGTIQQKNAPEDLVTAVPIYAVTAGNSMVFLGEVLADGEETPFRLSAPAGIRKVLLDPQQTILTAPK